MQDAGAGVKKSAGSCVEGSNTSRAPGNRGEQFNSYCERGNVVPVQIFNITIINPKQKEVPHADSTGLS
jgi:hypothetical protein